MQRFGLRDDQWERIKDFLPGREGHVGGNAADNRLFVEAVLYRYRTGIPWRDLPARFGDWKIVHQRFSRWAKSGVFERIFKLLASDHDNEYMMIDATIVRAHQHSAGARKKRPAAASDAVSIVDQDRFPEAGRQSLVRRSTRGASADFRGRRDDRLRLHGPEPRRGRQPVASRGVRKQDS